ncbi:MAG: hypothetical protein IPM94_16090 [bacterium]|nr:hypothetical protein [bacterium]
MIDWVCAKINEAKLVVLLLVSYVTSLVVPIFINVFQGTFSGTRVVPYPWSRDPSAVLDTGILGFVFLVVYVRIFRRRLPVLLEELDKSPAIRIDTTEDIRKDLIKPISVRANVAIIFVALLLNLTWIFPVLNDGTVSWLEGWGGVTSLSGAGYYNIFVRTLYNILVGYFVVQFVRMSLFLRVFASRSRLVLDALNLDGSGGLQVVSRLHAVVVLPFLVVGITVATILISNTYILNHGLGEVHNVAMIVAYFGAVVAAFVVPLLPFRSVMCEEKKRYLSSLADIYREASQIVGDRSARHEVVLSQYETMATIKSLYADVSKFPVWPFNTRTILRILATMSLPFTSLVLPVLAERFVTKWLDKLQ